MKKVVIALMLMAGCAAPPQAATTLTLSLPSANSIDVPRVEGIVIDGHGEEWGERGYHIDLLHSLSRQRPASRDLDARGRIAWSDAGLLLRIDVTDDVTYESPDDATLWMADGIEFFFVDKLGGNQLLQLVVGPSGRQMMAGKLSLQKPSPQCVVATSKRDGGYCVEVLVPWSVLKRTPEVGMEMGVQFYANDSDNTPARKKLIWFPRNEAFADTTKMNRIRLAEAATTPAESIASLQYDRLPGVVAQAATRSGSAKLLTVFDGDREIARGAYVRDGDLSAASALVPLPPLDSPDTTITLKQDGHFVAMLSLPSLQKKRIDAADRLEFLFQPFVFNGNVFPPGEFANPERAQMLIGNYRISTRFFDAQFNEVTRPATFGRFGAIVEITADGMPPMRRFITLYRMKEKFDREAWKPEGHLALPDSFGVDPAWFSTEEFASYLRGRFEDGFTQDGWTAVMLAGISEAKFAESAPGRLSVGYARDRRWWFDLRKHAGLPVQYPALVFEPKTPLKPGEKRPLMIFLHGSGERGQDLSMLENGGPRKFAKAHADFPFVLISPQCPGQEWWDPHRILDQIDAAMKTYDIDPDRVYITGLSLGGYGTWSTLQVDAKRFAAAAPICGGGPLANLDDMKDLPIWVVHGGQDKQVDPRQSYKFVDGLRKLGGRVRFTFYPRVGHDVWTATYADPTFYEWMLQQKRGEPVEPRATSPGTQPSEVR